MLSSATDAASRSAVELELRDRFGSFPEPLDTLLSVLAFKARVNELGVARADLMPDRVRVTWAEGQKRVKPEAIVRRVMANGDRVRMQPPASLDVILASGSYLELAVSQLVINLRYCLMSCSLSQ